MHEPGDLHALAGLSRGRKERDVVAFGLDGFGIRRRYRLEEAGANPGQRGVRIGWTVRLRHRRMRQAAERRPRPIVSLRNRGQKPRGPPRDGRDEAAGGPVVNRHVQQHHRHVERHVDRVAGRHRRRRESKQVRDVDETGLIELPRVLPRQHVEVGPDRAAGRQVLGCDTAEAQVLQGRRQGPSEAAQFGDRREIAERTPPGFLESGAGGDRLGPEPGGGGQPAAGQTRRRDPVASRRRLKRWRPNVAPRRAAPSRAKSSTASRAAPTMSASEAGGRLSRKRCAAARRAGALAD